MFPNSQQKKNFPLGKEKSPSSEWEWKAYKNRQRFESSIDFSRIKKKMSVHPFKSQMNMHPITMGIKNHPVETITIDNGFALSPYFTAFDNLSCTFMPFITRHAVMWNTESNPYDLQATPNMEWKKWLFWTDVSSVTSTTI